MGNDPSWNTISKEAKDTLLGLLTLKLIKDQPDTNAGLAQRIQQVTNNVWLTQPEMRRLTAKLENEFRITSTTISVPVVYHRYGKPDSIKNTPQKQYSITPNGREEIEDRLQQIERFKIFVLGVNQSEIRLAEVNKIVDAIESKDNQAFKEHPQWQQLRAVLKGLQQ